VPRIKRSVHARKKRRKTLEQAKGYVGQPHVSYRKAKEAILHADVHAYRDRKKK
jgi:large subunit ribosomal protein L20